MYENRTTHTGADGVAFAADVVVDEVHYCLFYGASLP